jgi:membrane associated rhomboid family serine protease
MSTSRPGGNYYRSSMFGGFSFFPPVIKSLLIANVAFFALALFLGLFTIDGFPLSRVIGDVFPLYPIGNGFQVWQLVTYMFMHGSFMHLLFNMFALWMFGLELENEWGSKKFLGYYMLCGLGGALANLFVAPLFAPAAPTVGASGAIYGVLLAFGMMYPDRPIFVYFLLPIRARYFVMIYMALEIYAGVASTSDGVAHFAHLGGAAVGFLAILWDQKRFPFQDLLTRRHERYVPTEKVNEYSGVAQGRIYDAKYYDVRDRDEKVSQARVDEILDKISQSGYQSLSESEKKLLFDASKKLN